MSENLPIYVGDFDFNIRLMSGIDLSNASHRRAVITHQDDPAYEKVRDINVSFVVNALTGEIDVPILAGDLTTPGNHIIQFAARNTNASPWDLAAHPVKFFVTTRNKSNFWA